LPKQIKNIDTDTLNGMPITVILHNGETIFYINKFGKNKFKLKKNKSYLLKDLINEADAQLITPVLNTGKSIECGLMCSITESKKETLKSYSEPAWLNNKKCIQTIIFNEGFNSESRDLLDIISTNSQDVIFHIDFSSGNKIKFISESSKKILGLGPKELYEDFSKLKQSIVPKDRPLFAITKQEYLKRKGDSKNNVIRVRQGLKNPKLIEIATNPVFNRNKELTGITGTIRDISSSAETENLLLETKNKFDLITNNANDIIAFFTYLPQPSYLYVSPNIKNVLGYQPEELLKQNTFFSSRLISGHEKFNHFVELLRKNQRKGIKKNVHFAFNTQNKAGESVWLENNLVPILNSKGKIDFYINILRDITEQKEAELEVENQYINYRNLLDNSPAAYMIHHQGICLYLNQALLKVLKYKSKSDLLGKFVIDLFDGPDRQKALNRIKEIYTNKSTGDKLSNYKVRDKNGNLVEVEIRSVFIKFNNKDCVISIVDNISEKRQKEREKVKAQVTALANIKLQKEIAERMEAEKSLREKTGHLSAVFESSTHLIWTVNRKFELTSFNQNFYKKIKDNFGVRIKLGSRVEDLLSEHKEKYINYWHPRYNETFSGKKLEFEKEDLIESKLYRKVFINPVYNNDQIDEISCMAYDITESKIYEQKLLNQSGKLSAIFDSSHHYIWTIDREGRLTSFNRNYYDLVTAIYNTKPFLGLILNRGVLSNDKEYNDLLKFHYEKAFSGLANSFEIETRDKDLKNVYLEVFFNPIYQNNTVVEVSGIAHNITEKKLAQQRIEISLKEKEVLLKEVHHRVKNNMQVISSILNLQSSYVSDAYALSLLKESQNRIKTMAYIHESLYQNKSFTSVNFSEYVETLINNIIQSYTYSADKIKMKFNIEPVILSLDSSIPAGLIINELVTNSIKHAFPGHKTGIITFNLSYKNNYVILELKDNGTGFAPGIDFANSHSLGLQLVNTLMEQLGAKLKFKSQKDKGTEVSVSFKV